jgi:Flp pilus assembly protein CpaB
MRYALCIAAFLLSNLLALAETETVTVLVARQRITYGTLLKEHPEKYFKAVRYVKGDEPKNAVSNFEQLKGKRVNRPLQEDQPVKTQDLMEPKPVDSPEGVLPKGMQAIAIRVSLTTTAIGFILPGSRVDVISSTRKGDKGVSSTILSNVLVLATDSVATRLNEKGPIATTMTLAVKPEDGVKLRLAELSSEFTLALCPADEDSGKPNKADEQKLKVPSGARAIAVKVAPTAINGFVLPSSRVDVLSTIRKGDKSVSSTIVRNVRILAIDCRTVCRSDDDPGPVIVMLALAPKDVEKVIGAQADGEIGLALCPPDKEPPVRSSGDK